MSRALTVGNLGYGGRYLADCLRSQDIQLGNQGIGNSLYGLQSMGDTAEVRELVAALTPRVMPSPAIQAILAQLKAGETVHH